VPMSRKFLSESIGEKIVKISQCIAKIWTKYDSLVFWATLYVVINNNIQRMALWKIKSLIVIKVTVAVVVAAIA